MKEIKKNPVKITLDGKIWLNLGDEKFIGEGKIELIEKIKEFGTLFKAAEAMKISYRQACFHITYINNLTDKPFVILKRGGKGGGYSEITEVGEKVILMFRQFQADFKKFLEVKTKAIEL
jgi:molybdate transport system regulatory protein